MSGIVYNGNYPTGIVLNNLATQEVTTITGMVSNPAGDAVLGTTLFPWTVNNQGTIDATGTAGDGIELLQGGTVNNQTATALIEGYDGVLIKGAAGLVTNLGTIEATGTAGSNSRGVLFTEGGKVVNGSAADTTASIAGVAQAVLIEGAAGTVTNFGTITNSSTHATIVLFEGGTVTNGVSTSTAALITGVGTGIYFKYAGGGVTNFGGIVGSTGVSLHDGGTVTNGASGSTAATITGTNGAAVTFDGTSGTVTNFGTLASSQNHAAVSLNVGGRITNGSAAVTTALIASQGTGISILQGGTLTNFGTIASLSATAGTAAVLENGGSIANDGTIENTFTGNSGIYIHGGGAVTNGKNGATVGLISGAGTGISFREGATGTVNNSGTVQSATANAIYLGGGGNVTNTVGALIAGHNNSVGVRNAAATIVNAGTLLGSLSSAIYLEEGGSITNQAGGQITSNSSNALTSKGAAATVTNAGLLQASGDAVYMSGGGTITNQAGGTLASSGNAVFVRAVAVNISNAGTIQSTTTGADGIYLGFGGNVTNTGSAALISGGANGVFVISGLATVSNSGTIRAVGTVGPLSGAGVNLGAGGAVTNLTGGVLAGVQDGVISFGVPVTVTNTGIITSSGTYGAYLRGGGLVTNQGGGLISGGLDGVRLWGPNSATVVNRGTITGGIGLYNNPFFAPNLTVTNFGTIASTAGTTGTAVVLGSSADKNLLIVESGAVFVGGVNGGGNGEVDFVASGVANVTNMFGFATIELGDGVGHTLTLTDPNFNSVNFNHIMVIGANNAGTVNIVNIVNASAVTLHPVIFVGGGATGTGTITDHFTGGASNDVFEFSATNLTSADTVNGSGGFDNALLMTSPGTVAATGVTGVEIYQLANGGGNSLSLANGNFTGVAADGGFIRVYGGDSGNTINASAVTGAADQVVMYGGTGTDTLTGGAGNDVFVFTAASLTAADTVAGGGGANELLMTSAGTIQAGGVSGVESYALANSGVNILDLGAANFGGITAGRITVYDGNAGNAVGAAGLSSGEAITVYAGTGADALTGGAGNDVFVAGGNTSMTGGAGANRFEFLSSAAATNTIVDFATSGTNGLVFSNTAFALGFTGGAAAPKLWTSTGGFVADGATGFTSSSQRLWYDSVNGDLSFSASGTNATAHLIASLSTGLSISAATQLFFVT